MNESRAAGFTMLAGGALVVLGAFLPWITASAPFVGTVNRSLMDNGSDGWFLFIAGAGVLALGLVAAVRGPRPWLGGVALIPLALAGWVVVLDYGDISGRVHNITNGPDNLIIAALGPGPYASGFGILIALVACAMLVFGQSPKPQEGKAFSPPPEPTAAAPAAPGHKLGELSADAQFYWNGEGWLPNS